MRRRTMTSSIKSPPTQPDHSIIEEVTVEGEVAEGEETSKIEKVVVTENTTRTDLQESSTRIIHPENSTRKVVTSIRIAHLESSTKINHQESTRRTIHPGSTTRKVASIEVKIRREASIGNKRRVASIEKKRSISIRRADLRDSRSRISHPMKRRWRRM